jgi:hypothetical protein
MGHPYRRQVYPIPPLPVLLPLAVVDALVVLLPIAPWMCQPGHQFRMLLAPVVGLPIGLLLGVQTVLWNFLRTWWTRSKAEADAAFAAVSASLPEFTIPKRTGAPAAVFVEWVPNRHGRRAWFDVYVDDRPVWTVTGERLTPVITSQGHHRIFIKANHMKSDEVELDLTAGAVRHVVCGMKPLIQNRFFRFFEMKLKFVAFPVAFACFFIPAAMRILKEHFAVEFFAILILGFLGFYVSLPRYFSRRPGAMIYLAELRDPVEVQLRSRDVSDDSTYQI